MAVNTLICPNCKKNIELSEVLLHEFQEEFELKHKKDMSEAVRIAEEKAKIEFEKKNSEEIEKLKKQNEQAEESLRKKELETVEEKRKLEEAKKEFEKTKKQEEEKIREAVAKEESEKHRLEKLEWEKQKADMQKTVEELQRKGKQGSQQLQGEVLELDLEEQLKTQFPFDEFLPVPKGVEGGDIWQKVCDKSGNTIGSILWETKRTKTWSNNWLPKLREDSRKINASESILVTQVLPNGVKSFDRKDNVWVANYEYAIQTARYVRFLIMNIAAAKSSASHKDEELKAIYDYITSETFKHKFQAHQEGIEALRNDLISEKKLTEIRWKKREIQIERLDKNSSHMYAELQGIVPELPDIEIKELDSGEDD